jgi:probable rRNA maturation factor
MGFSLTNRTKGSLSRLARLPFVKMKDAILGPGYELGLVFVTPSEIRNLNAVHRKKNVPTDILSFPLDKMSGEIFINQQESRKEAKKFGRDYINFIQFLFIHGCTHLKGFTHGSRMESEERKFRKLFKI